MTSNEVKTEALRTTYIRVGVLIAYHAAIAGLLLWEALFDAERFIRVLNDPNNTLLVVLGLIALLAGTVVLSYVLLLLPIKRRAQERRADQ